MLIRGEKRGDPEDPCPLSLPLAAAGVISDSESGLITSRGSRSRLLGPGMWAGDVFLPCGGEALPGRAGVGQSRLCPTQRQADRQTDTRARPLRTQNGGPANMRAFAGKAERHAFVVQGCPVPCRIFSSAPDLRLRDASSMAPPPTPAETDKMCPHVPECLPGGRLIPCGEPPS